MEEGASPARLRLNLTLTNQKRPAQLRGVFSEESKPQLFGAGGTRQTFGQTAFLARGFVFVNDAFGCGAINDAHGDVLFAANGFFDFGFDARFGDLIAQLFGSVLAQTLFG